MSLKLGPLPDRNPVKLAVSLTPEVHDALGDYAALHAESYGREAPLADLAALMIEEFLNRDAAFKRARKALGRHGSSEEKAHENHRNILKDRGRLRRRHPNDDDQCESQNRRQ